MLVEERSAGPAMFLEDHQLIVSAKLLPTSPASSGRLWIGMGIAISGAIYFAARLNTLRATVNSELGIVIIVTVYLEGCLSCGSRSVT
jgi:hypothetical protein